LPDVSRRLGTAGKLEQGGQSQKEREREADRVHGAANKKQTGNARRRGGYWGLEAAGLAASGLAAAGLGAAAGLEALAPAGTLPPKVPRGGGADDLAAAGGAASGGGGGAVSVF